MEIRGLENNYYLAGNDIWISVLGFYEPILKLELIFTNLTTGTTLRQLTLYPNPNNEFSFNVCAPIRALFPIPNHISNNNLHQFSIAFKSIYESETLPDEVNLTKYFLRAYKEKGGVNEWYLQDGAELVIKPWGEWQGVYLGNAQKIQGSIISNFVPDYIKVLKVRDCEFRILKFRNSLGGYQYFVFSAWEIENKSKGQKIITKHKSRLRENGFRNLGSEFEKNIKFSDNTSFEMQDVFTDMVNSSEVYLYDSEGDDNDSSWIALALESNKSIKNNFDFVYENEISFNIINDVKNSI